jgi:ABC-2 type transport system permease protein
MAELAEKAGVARPAAPAPPGRLPGPGRLLAGQVRYQALLLLRSPRAMWAGVLLPVMLLVLTNIQHASVAASALASRAVLGVTLTAYLTHAAGLVAAREAGVLKRWRATPLPPWCYFAGRMAATVLLAIVSGAVTVTVGVVVYHAELTPGGAVSLLLALGMAALAWAGVGTAMTAVIPTADAAQPLLAFAYFPVMLLSGVLGGLGGLPPWLATALRYLPGQPTVDAATRALQAGAAVSVPPRDLAVLAAWAVVALLVSLRTFRWEPRAAR